MVRLIITIVFLLNSLFTFSQGDSLYGVWKDKSLTDSVRLRALGTLTLSIMQNHPDSCEKLADEGIRLANKIKRFKQEAYLWNSKGGALLYKGNLNASTKAYQKSITIYEKEGVTPVNIYGNLGTIYFVNKDNEKAIYYFKNALEGASEDDYNTRAQVTHNIGSAYISLKDYEKALTYLRESEQYRIKQNQENLLSLAYNQISIAYMNLNEMDSAIYYVFKALKIVEKEDFYSQLYIYTHLADIELKQKNYKTAIEYAKKALDLARMIDNLASLEVLTHTLSMAYEKTKNIDSAYAYFKEYKIIHDSINNSEAAKKLVAEQLTFEHEKENALKEKEYQSTLLVEKTKQEQQLIIIIISIISLIGVIIMFTILSKKFKVTKQQKLVIEEKNKEITDSIQYAKRIQAAILPSNKAVKKHLPNSFILYKPKDIVAGDFYWMESSSSFSSQEEEIPFPLGDSGEAIILFAAADCTGHGVPGAMVSVVCNNALNRSVREYGLKDPGKILDKTREIVIEEFEKSDDEVKDGMDIALCSLKQENGNWKLKYAGAHNPLWIIRKGEIIETKANKQPIGKYDNIAPYTTHNFNLEKGDTIYIFSDGYVDQFGGEKGKKYKAQAFRLLLLAMQHENMETQKRLINEAFETWRGDIEQIDDVCIIGVRI
jgi:serine phosphatase RsbU (regulator of sigma subunit)